MDLGAEKKKKGEKPQTSELNLQGNLPGIPHWQRREKEKGTIRTKT